jgi:NADH-quinone oxidoreductase subunit H
VAEFFSQYLSPPWLAYVLTALIQVALILAVVLTAAGAFTWAERKVSARMQDRLGPTRVGGRFGWLQALADGIKLVAKEDIIPAGADGLLFRVAPYISFCASFAVFLALPFSDGWVAQRVDVAVFFILAVAGLEVFGVILAGYSSGSKWSLFGAMREAAQVVSYEIPLAICVVVPVMIAGTMDLVSIGAMQSGWFTNWLVLHDPFTFLTFFVYATCAIASVNRAPFDLAEAESELVAGFMTEYSGFRWAVFFMAEYGSMVAVSGLAAILFFGGPNGPLPVAHWLGLEHGALLGGIGNFLGLCNFLLKATMGVLVMMWARWTLPRLRIDQVMTTCLKYCVPLGAAMLLGAMLWTYAFPDGLILSSETLLCTPAGATRDWRKDDMPTCRAISKPEAQARSVRRAATSDQTSLALRAWLRRPPQTNHGSYLPAHSISFSPPLAAADAQQQKGR